MTASPLDFYLPPPDDRAYRRDKIQRLRDQITAWRRNTNRGDHTIPKTPTLFPNNNTIPSPQSLQLLQSTQLSLTTPAAAAAELPRWRSAAVSPTRMCTSRHEKLFLQSCVTENWQREKRGEGLSQKRRLLTLGTSNTTNTIASRVLEVPYFHDQAIFCVPGDSANTGGDHPSPYKEEKEEKDNNESKEDKEEGRGRAVDVWYGVTSNSEESGRQLEMGTMNDGSVHNTLRNTGNNSGHDHSNSNNHNNKYKYNPNSSHLNDKSTLGDTPGQGNNVIDSFFAVKLQSVDLAMSVHEERMRRKSIMQQRQRRDSVKHQQSEEMFSKTMEIPIDWDEFRRLSPDCTTPRAKTAMGSSPTTSMPNRRLNTNNITTTSTNNNNNNSNTNKSVAAIQSHNSTIGTPYSHTIHSGYTHGGSTNAGMGDVDNNNNTRSDIRPHTTTPHIRPPLRLYAIRVRRKVMNSETSMMRPAEAAPRLGTRVVLPKSWLNQ